MVGAGLVPLAESLFQELACVGIELVDGHHMQLDLLALDGRLGGHGRSAVGLLDRRYLVERLHVCGIGQLAVGACGGCLGGCAALIPAAGQRDGRNDARRELVGTVVVASRIHIKGDAVVRQRVDRDRVLVGRYLYGEVARLCRGAVRHVGQRRGLARTDQVVLVGRPCRERREEVGVERNRYLVAVGDLQIPLRTEVINGRLAVESVVVLRNEEVVGRCVFQVVLVGYDLQRKTLADQAVLVLGLLVEEVDGILELTVDGVYLLLGRVRRIGVVVLVDLVGQRISVAHVADGNLRRNFGVFVT